MSELGAKIIEGLKQVAAGDFARVTIEGQTWERVRPRTPGLEQRAEIEALKQAAEIKKLQVAYDALLELHGLLDFEEPLTDKTPWLFEDASDINAAFVKAYAAIELVRAHQQKESEGK